MIIFNNLGHTFKVSDDGDSPIVWVDSSDNTTYTLSGSDVLTLDNKGTLGGAMTLNGAVKFANSGFESWTASDFIIKDLGEAFLPNNSFTIATTFDLQDITSGSNLSYNYFLDLWGGTNSNRIGHFRGATTTNNDIIFSGTRYNSGVLYNNLGVKTLIFTLDLSTNTAIVINEGGSNTTYNSIVFNNTLDCLISLLKAQWFAGNSGANNPLHEFRLYDRAFSLTEMQDLQTELNNKYTP